MTWVKSISSVYGRVVQYKNRLFDEERLRIHRLPIPVISIGNLTVGGTGKTPFVDLCVKKLLQKNLKVGVVSRAYKARAKKPARVDVSHIRAAAEFGDEPVWLAQQNPAAEVFVGARKWEIAAWALTQEKLNVIVMDDGFQHRALHRDLDIVVLDATERWERYQVLPAGRARESFENITRANLIVLSKTNWAAAEDLIFLRHQLPAGIPVMELSARTHSFRNFVSGAVASARDLGDSVFLFCSIARPDLFEREMRENFGQVELLAFSDHHPYDEEDIHRILTAKTPGSVLICTEKDAVKLKKVWPAAENLWVSCLKTEITSGEEKLDQVFAELFA